MYIIVQLLNGFTQPLTYAIPDTWHGKSLLGQVVRVPLQKRSERALVCEVVDSVSAHNYLIREALAVEPLPQDERYHAFLEQVSSYYAIPLTALYRRVHQYGGERISDGGIAGMLEEQIGPAVALTKAQQAIVDALTPYITTPRYHTVVLHGVTGSGKTEVYRQLLYAACKNGKSALFLVPEVSLAISFVRLFRETAEMRVHAYHSSCSAAEKKQMWSDIIAELPVLIVGVHLPVLIPLRNLGIIIIDEEHDAGFQQKRHPRLHVKEIALLRARQYGIPIVLGSATPSISSLYNVAHRGWQLLQLLERFSGTFPRITCVPLIRANSTVRSVRSPPDYFWITQELRVAIADRLARREQVIIFLNRRGMHRFVQCATCTHIWMCPHCSVSMTLHASCHLLCHYCGERAVLPKQCTQCAAPESALVKKGVGTQRIVALLQELFPMACIERADMDTARERKQWQHTLKRMKQGEVDILVGTQTITKGYHFPQVTLVGIIWAESSLSIPFYTAAERTVQQLLQVAGRAGRAGMPSEVIIQSFIAHPIFSYLHERDYTAFYDYEIAQRVALQYPPCSRMSEIELQCKNEQQLDDEAHHISELLRIVIQQWKWEITVLGPALPPIHRIQCMSMRKIYIKGGHIAQHRVLWDYVQKRVQSARAYFTPNPIE